MIVRLLFSHTNRDPLSLEVNGQFNGSILKIWVIQPVQPFMAMSNFTLPPYFFHYFFKINANYPGQPGQLR